MSASTPVRRRATSAAPPASTTGRSAPAAGRGRPRHPDIDRAILTATFHQLVEVGYGNLSVEAVAAAAGVAKTTIYRRYPTKRDLVIAALQVEIPFPSPPPDADTRSALRSVVEVIIHAIVDSGAIRILGSLLVEDPREPDLLATFRRRLLEPRRALVIELLRRGIERGEVRPDADPLIVTEMMAGAIFGHHAILGERTTEAWVDGLMDHVWAAIRA